MSDRDQMPRWLLWLGGLALAGWLLYALRGVLAPFFFAFLIAYVLDPVVDRVEGLPFLRNTRFARGVGIGALLVVVFGVSTLAFLVVVPAVVEEVARFLERLPSSVRSTWGALEPQLAEYGITLPKSVEEALEDLQLDVQGFVAQTYAPASAAVRWLLGGTASAVGAVVAGIMIPVFAFYLTYDFDRITASIGQLIPPRYREQTTEIFRDIDGVLGQFFRGQFTVMAVLAVLYSVGYGLVGVPLALPIGLMAGLLSFIPYFGSLSALASALLMTGLEWQGWGQVLWVLGVHLTIQSLEGFVITPKIMGDTVGLSAITVLFALLVGGELLGFTGVLLALPAAAVIKVLAGRAVGHYRGSPAFVGAGSSLTELPEDSEKKTG